MEGEKITVTLRARKKNHEKLFRNLTTRGLKDISDTSTSIKNISWI